MAYQDEDSVKARLRELTAETRRLRRDLDALVQSGATKDLTRGMIHVSGKVKLDAPAAAPDRPRKARKKR